MGLTLSTDDGNRATGPMFAVRGRVYRIASIVGQGGEATVYRCEDQAGFEHAVKVFYFSRYPQSQVAQRIESFDKEGRILKYLSGRSRHFMRVMDYEYKPGENVGYMVMELGEGSLRKHLQGLPLDDPQRRMYWKQIVAILRALDDAQIVHADIKPDNIIVVNGTLKVTDLGLAFRLSSSRDVARRQNVRGTLDYMAPEVFTRRTGFKSDIWSAGIILYEMSYGRPPYFGITDRDQKVAAIASRTPIPFPPLNDRHLLDCMKQCLQFDSRNRPSAHQLQVLAYSRF